MEQCVVRGRWVFEIRLQPSSELGKITLMLSLSPW